MSILLILLVAVLDCIWGTGYPPQSDIEASFFRFLRRYYHPCQRLNAKRWKQVTCGGTVSFFFRSSRLV